MSRVPIRRYAVLTAMLSCLLLDVVPAFAEGRISPVAVSAEVVAADPVITTRDFGGHKAWSIIWRRDAEGRELRVGFIEDLQLPYREHPQEMLDFAHDETAGAAIEQTLDLPGRAEELWRRNVFWLVMSERAADGQQRRNCAVFTADPAPRLGTLIGAFCRDLPAGAKVDEATARQWLDDLDLRVP